MSLTQQERAQLLSRLRDLDARLFPPEESEPPENRIAARLRDECLLILAEYGDRLPRVVMGACPFTGMPLKRSFDPFGLDGPWWWKDRPFKIEEPAAPPAFQLLVGALDLRGRIPAETVDGVIPGPA